MVICLAADLCLVSKSRKEKLDSEKQFDSACFQTKSFSRDFNRLLLSKMPQVCLHKHYIPSSSRSL